MVDQGSETLFLSPKVASWGNIHYNLVTSPGASGSKIFFKEALPSGLSRLRHVLSDKQGWERNLMFSAKLLGFFTWLTLVIVAIFTSLFPATIEAITPSQTTALTQSLQVTWVQTNPGPGAQTHPQTAYDPFRNELLLVWEDGRNDPQGLVDHYGFQYNGDIFARRYDASTGLPITGTVAIATDGEFPVDSGRYDNEQRPAIIFDPGSQRYVISWQTIPDSVLEEGNLHTTTCYDIYARSYAPDNDELSQVTEDLAWYTPPADLVSPWGVYYDWSCQQDPVMTLLAENRPFILWHDHRERYATDSQGIPFEKDVYGQVLQEGNRTLQGAFLVSRRNTETTERLPRYQEHPDVAGSGEQHLVVWEDERQSNASSGNGFREIYGRFITYRDGVIAPGEEILIGAGQEGDGPDDFRLVAPRVGYLSDDRAYMVVWSQVQNYTQASDASYQLVWALVGGDGSILQPPTPIPDTVNHRAQTHDIACAANRCILIYRKRDQVLYARLLTRDGPQPIERRIDNAEGVYGYGHIQTGNVNGDAVSFFASYVVNDEVHLARFDTLLYRPNTPTPPSCQDAFEPDDRWENASLFQSDTRTQQRTFHRADDIDYVRFSATRGEIFTFATSQLGPQVDTILTLLAPDGVSPMIINDDDPLNAPASRILWRATATGDYFLRIANRSSAGACDMTYTLSIDRLFAPTSTSLQYLPLFHH